jgi:hypothetical protein
MTSREFTESVVFDALEPDPAEETVRLLAILLTWYANQHRDTRAKPQPFTVDDFLPNPYGPSKAERQAAFAATMAQFEANRKARLAT